VTRRAARGDANRTLRIVVSFVVAAFLVVAVTAAGASGRSSQTTSAGPFYLVPSATTECRGVKNCIGSSGPWVAVPATGEATYLFGCPSHIDYIVAGTDALASGRNIRVWFEDKIGGRIGPPVAPNGHAVLLFHGASNDGKPGWFRPIVGCVSLVPKNKRSTVSARAGTPPSAAVDLRAEDLRSKPQADLGEQTRALRCPGNEQPVTSWGAFVMYTTDPPSRAFVDAMTIATVITGDRVIGHFHLNRRYSTLAPQFWVQIGAACEP
jgi:hypothetical protein